MIKQRILVLGAGGVGLYYGGRLARAGHDVVFQARGANLAALREGGLRVSSTLGDFSLPAVQTAADSDKAAGLGPYDLILVALKSYQTTAEVLSPLVPALSPRGTVLTLQNGVGSTEPLRRVFGPAAVLAGIAFVGTRLISPGRVSHTAAGHLVMGEMGEMGEMGSGSVDDGRSSPRLEKVVSMFRDAGVDAIPADDIRREQWRKLIWNAPFNGMTALTGLSPRDLLAEPSARLQIRAAMLEVIAVARALGIDLSEGVADETLAFTERAGTVRTSMLVDREKGRRMEVDALYGPPIEEGRRLGVPTPILCTLQAMLLAVDRQLRSDEQLPDA